MDFLRNYFVVLLALILVFVLNVSFTLGERKIEASYDFEEFKVLKVKEGRLQLQCNSSVKIDPSSSNSPSVKWFKDGKPLTDQKHYDVDGLKLMLKRSSWADYSLLGNYSCVLYFPNSTEAIEQAYIYVVAKPYVKILHNQVIVIEGEQLEIECLIYGRPTPIVVWHFENNTYYDNSDERVKIITSPGDDDNFIRSTFRIDHSLKSDRGEYTCTARNDADRNPDDKEISKNTCFVRIKDKYAALWPFLGICVEVVVLCAVIFIYEKKRNKAELEESDTDQSPEQKNTPDHGKESVRQRK